MEVTINSLKGITVKSARKSRDLFEITGECGCVVTFHHVQDCCEDVELIDITEDWHDILIGETIVGAYESSNSDGQPMSNDHESWTWTFYRIITPKGIVVMRWYGASNGYYSEKVDISMSVLPD